MSSCVRPVLGSAIAAAMLAGAGACSCGPTLRPRDSGMDAGGTGTDAAGTDATLVPDAGPPGTGTLVVAGWNVENFPGASNTIGDVASLVEDMELDVMGMEEIADTAAFDALLASMPGWDGLYASEDDGFTRVGLLWRTATVQATDFETMFTSDSWAFPRPPLKARIFAMDAAGGLFDFTIVVVHLKAQSDAESEDRRRMAVAALHAWVVTELQTGQEDDFIIVGDWNDELTDADPDNVFIPFLDEPDVFTFLDLPLEQSGMSTYIPFSSSLDHVLVTNGALDEYGAMGVTDIVMLDAVVPGYESTISDHRPVRVTFNAAF